MAESEDLSQKENVNKELQISRGENLFCRKCVRYFASKSEFNQHVQEHIKKTNGGKTSYMSYIEKYICSICSAQFEVRSDLIIHYNTVCFDAPYTCKHCKENCENQPFLQMHLMFHHNYSEEMLRDEGFLTDVENNPFLSKNPSMKASRRAGFKSPLPEDANSIYNIENLSLPDVSSSYRQSRKNGKKRGKLAFNMLNKAHTCEICSESFSRKCVLDIHVQKHVLKEKRKKRVPRDISLKSSIMTSCENNCIPARKTESKHSDSAEVPGQHSNRLRTILKPCNVALGSSVWTKVQPKCKLQSPKSFPKTRSRMRKSKIINILEEEKDHPKSFKAISRTSTAFSAPSSWKKLKLRSKIPNFEASEEQKILENSMEKAKQGRKFQNAATTDKQNDPETPSQNVKGRRKIKADAASDEQISLETPNAARKSKSSKTKKYKKMPKNEAKHGFTCDMCERQFQDNYKLKRHHLIHTGERPYSCKKCSKSFARDDHLKRHLKKVCSKTDNSK